MGSLNPQTCFTGGVSIYVDVLKGKTARYRKILSFVLRKRKDRPGAGDYRCTCVLCGYAHRLSVYPGNG